MLNTDAVFILNIFHVQLVKSSDAEGWLYLVPLNSTLENCENGKYYYAILSQ